MIRTRAAVLALGMCLTLALTACSGGGSAGFSPTAAPAADPAGAGAYGVGTTTMTFTRQTATGPRALKTLFWYPATAAPGAAPQPDALPAAGHYPIVIFSHGSGGEPQFYQYLTRHLASWGFVVAAPEHPGNTLADCFLCDFNNIIASARLRPDDVTFVLDQVIALRDDASQPLGKIIDPERTALAGHSFGGWTAIFAAPSGRFDASIALAPGAPELLLKRATTVRIPTLIIAGAKDEVVSIDGANKLYAALPADIEKTYVTLAEGHHLSFIDNCLGCTEALTADRGHELINRYITAFLETRLLGDDRYAHFLSEDQPPDAHVAAR